jgi:hypothetical protein
VAQTTITIETFDKEGDEIQLKLPAKYQVCGTCEGRGTHVNPNIDGNGLSAEDFAEDPDFEEGYFRGDYDVQCGTCHGTRVVAVPDLPRCSFPQKRALVQYYRTQREIWRDDASERRLRMMESGECWG